MWRQCTKCNKIKPFYEFRKHSKGTFCLQSRCIWCEKQYNRNRKEENKYRMRKYRKKYPERAKKASYVSNRNLLERDPNYFKSWQKANKEKCRIAERKYSKNNLDKIAAKSARRRVVRKNNTVVLTDIEKDMVQILYTKSKELGSNYEVDHITPVSLGGSDHPLNLQIISTIENNRKSNKLDYEVKGLRIYWKEDMFIEEYNG